MLTPIEEATIRTFRFNNQSDELSDYFINMHAKYGHKFLTWVLDDMKKTIAEQNEKIYSYMITFTLDPKKHSEPEAVEEFVKLQAKRTGLHIKKAWLTKEHTQAGVPHWHMYVQLTKALRSDAFQHYQKRYGNVDISRSKYNSEADALSYMTKESDPVRLI